MGNKAQTPAKVQEYDRIDGKAFLFQNSDGAFYIPDDYMSTVDVLGPDNTDGIVSGNKYDVRIGYKGGNFNFKITIIDNILLKKFSTNPDTWVAEQDKWLPPPKLPTGGRRKHRLIKKNRQTRKRRV